jgi:hypothetical protein
MGLLSRLHREGFCDVNPSADALRAGGYHMVVVASNSPNKEKLDSLCETGSGEQFWRVTRTSVFEHDVASPSPGLYLKVDGALSSEDLYTAINHVPAEDEGHVSGGEVSVADDSAAYGEGSEVVVVDDGAAQGSARRDAAGDGQGNIFKSSTVATSAVDTRCTPGLGVGISHVGLRRTRGTYELASDLRRLCDVRANHNRPEPDEEEVEGTTSLRITYRTFEGGVRIQDGNFDSAKIADHLCPE